MWKAVVANTPRVLLEIISVLVKQLIAKLASPIEVALINPLGLGLGLLSLLRTSLSN